jgi:hypothetical protein
VNPEVSQFDVLKAVRNEGYKNRSIVKIEKPTWQNRRKQ